MRALSTIAERLAGWSQRLTVDNLPDAVVHEVKRRVIDSLACALGAYRSEACRIARAAAVGHAWLPGTPQAGLATVLGQSRRTLPELAAFANGAMVRYLDFNDTYLSKEPAHPSDNIAACLAVAESEGRTGADLIASIALAYEVQCRMCDAASLRARGWDHVTYGSYSSTLACAWLRRLDLPQTVHALGIAGTTGNYLRQTRSGELSMWKACAFAAAARNAVFATDLAGRGMTGPAPIFEGTFGLWNQVSGEFDLPPFGGEGGQEFMILRTYIKRWPVEYHAQSGVDAALQLREELHRVGADTADVDRLELRTFDACVDIIADPAKWHPTTRESADHSLPYCVAGALINGDVTMDSFSDERINDARVRELMNKITVHRDPECNAHYPEGIPNDLEIFLSDGRVLRRKVSFPRGHARNPMTDSEVEEKFRQLAGAHLKRETIDLTLKRLWDLDKVEDLSTILITLGDLE